MAEQTGQTFQNHAKIVPLFHYVLLPILGVNLVVSIMRLVRVPSFDSGLAAAVAFALILTAFFARVFALRVQDRVIRLEMRMRLRDALPPELAGRIGEFTMTQLVALRFASDAELPGLARRVLDEKLQDRKAIKQLIQNWQGDYHRA